MNKNTDITDAELEAQFVERNNNLKKTWNNIIDVIDTSIHQLEVPEQTAIGSNSSSTLAVDNSSSSSKGSFIAGGTTSSSGYYDEMLNGITTTGTSRRRPSVIGEQTSHDKTGWGINLLDSKLMNSINDEIHAMNSTNAELFETVASKIDETFGANALV